MPTVTRSRFGPAGPEPDGDGFVAVAPVGVEVVDGPCALSFHTHRPEFDGQENVGLVGTCSVIDREADGSCVVRVRVERALADWGVPRNPLRNALSMAAAGRRLRPRLAAEAARRGTPPADVRPAGALTHRRPHLDPRELPG